MADKALTLRLNKVLRELNISLDRAVEYLSGVGCDIEARPTTKISQQTYELLLEGFKTDKSDKDESAEISEVKRKEKEDLRIQQEKLEQDKANSLEKKSEIITASSSVRKFKPLGKIDLDSKKNISKDLKLKDNRVKDINKSDSENEITNVKRVKDDRPSLENEKLVTNYKKIVAPIKTGKTVDLEKIKEQEKNVEASRKKKRKRIAPKENNQKKPFSLNNQFKKSSTKKSESAKNQNLKVESNLHY